MGQKIYAGILPRRFRPFCVRAPAGPTNMLFLYWNSRIGIGGSICCILLFKINQIPNIQTIKDNRFISCNICLCELTQREREGTMGCFFVLVPKIFNITLSYLLLNIIGDLIHRRDNYVYHHWGSTSIYRTLPRPLRFLEITRLTLLTEIIILVVTLQVNGRLTASNLKEKNR